MMAGLHFVLGKIQEEQASPFPPPLLSCSLCSAQQSALYRMLETYYSKVVSLRRGHLQTHRYLVCEHTYTAHCTGRHGASRLSAVGNSRGINIASFAECTANHAGARRR